jgi:hypothetical protein
MWRQSSALRLSCSRGEAHGDSTCPAIGELFDLAIQLLSGRAADLSAWSRRAGKRWNDRQWKQYQGWDLRNVCGETRIVCHREWRKMAYFHLVGGPNGSRLDVNWKPEPAGAPLILTTVFNNPEAVSFGGNRLLEQA